MEDKRADPGSVPFVLDLCALSLLAGFEVQTDDRVTVHETDGISIGGGVKHGIDGWMLAADKGDVLHLRAAVIPRHP